jgi:CheY-like chemotaxis protein
MSKCILVVEDQEDNRQILRDLLGNAGYELTEAENGEEAIAAVARRRPDLSLLKIQFGAIEGGGQAAFRLADLMRLDAHSDDAGRRPPGRQ